MGIPHRMLFPNDESNTKQLVENLKHKYPNTDVEKELLELDEKENNGKRI